MLPKKAIWGYSLDHQFNNRKTKQIKFDNTKQFAIGALKCFVPFVLWVLVYPPLLYPLGKEGAAAQPAAPASSPPESAPAAASRHQQEAVPQDHHT